MIGYNRGFVLDDFVL